MREGSSPGSAIIAPRALRRSDLVPARSVAIPPPLRSLPAIPGLRALPTRDLGATTPFRRPALTLVPPEPHDANDATEVMQKLWFLDEELVPAPIAAPIVAPVIALPAPGGRISRALASSKLSHFHRLMFAALIANVVLAFTLSLDLATLSQLALGNFAVAICIRQHYVVNALFWIATRVPTSWPLAIRRQCAKVYHFGGIHVGGAIAGTAWFVAFAVSALRDASSLPVALLAVIVAQTIVLVAICVWSMPWIRAKHHDTFEIVKRLGGWTSLALLWPQTVMLGGTGELVVLGVITFSVALPWLRLRKVPVELVIPSSHVALARFDYGVTPFAGSSTAISRSPLLEWHSFANVPAPGQPGYRLTISRAGDWTGKLIDDRPSHLWVKGIPTAGVANIEVLFKRVVYVATGSGIGPCLPHLLANKVPAKLIWATRNARKTYGDALVDEILVEHPDALIWDTHERGKPDMVQLAYQALVETGAEAVICISNKKLTWEVVSGLESRGIPAYGAIWDS